MGGRCWDGGELVVTINRMAAEGLLGKTAFEQIHEESEGVGQISGGGVFPACDALRQACVEASARRPI